MNRRALESCNKLHSSMGQVPLTHGGRVTASWFVGWVKSRQISWGHVISQAMGFRSGCCPGRKCNSASLHRSYCIVEKPRARVFASTWARQGHHELGSSDGNPGAVWATNIGFLGLCTDKTASIANTCRQPMGWVLVVHRIEGGLQRVVWAKTSRSRLLHQGIQYVRT